MRRLYIFLVLFFCFSTSISAQENDYPVQIPVTSKKYEAEPQKFPVHINSIYPWGIHGQQSKNYIYNFSLSLVAGMVRGVNGLQLSGVYSQAPDFFNGVQIAGGGNSTMNLKGLQTAGVTNYTVNMRGIQIAGFANAASVDAKGIQVSGFLNGAADIKGIQIGGIGNAAGNMTGVQIGGFSNIAQTINGLQISGTYNRVDTLKGISISIVSVTDTIESGIALSLVNIVRQGFYREWEIAFSNYVNVALSYKMGTQKFYSIYTAGANFIENNHLITGFGFGNRTPIGKQFDFQPELIMLNFFPTNFKNIQYDTETHLKLGFVYRINEKFGISFAPGVYVNNNKTVGLSASLGLKIM